MKRWAWNGSVAAAVAWAGVAAGQTPWAPAKGPAATATARAANPPAAGGNIITLRTAGQPERKVQVLRSDTMPDGKVMSEVKDLASGQVFQMFDEPGAAPPPATASAYTPPAALANVPARPPLTVPPATDSNEFARRMAQPKPWQPMAASSPPASKTPPRSPDPLFGPSRPTAQAPAAAASRLPKPAAYDNAPAKPKIPTLWDALFGKKKTAPAALPKAAPSVATAADPSRPRPLFPLRPQTAQAPAPPQPKPASRLPAPNSVSPRVSSYTTAAATPPPSGVTPVGYTTPAVAPIQSPPTAVASNYHTGGWRTIDGSTPPPPPPPVRDPAPMPATFLAPAEDQTVAAAPVETRMADEARPLLTDLRDTLRPSVRMEAATGLARGRYGSRPEVKRALLDAARTDPSASVRAHCVECLAHLGHTDAEYVRFLHEQARDGEIAVKLAAKTALDRLGVR